jgi:hypothetical protein
MALQRADLLTEPPIVGRMYLVPAIPWAWNASALVSDPHRSDMWWPVIGPKHTDLEFFNFRNPHYHVDPRFLSKRHWRRLWDRPDGGKLLDVLGRPLSWSSLPDGPREPELRQMRCTRDVIEYPVRAATSQGVCELNNKYAGHQCVKGKRGWVCPHRKVSLGSVKPIDGVVTCFLHGLRIDVETGVCLGPVAREVRT